MAPRRLQCTHTICICASPFLSSPPTASPICVLPTALWQVLEGLLYYLTPSAVPRVLEVSVAPLTPHSWSSLAALPARGCSAVVWSTPQRCGSASCDTPSRRRLLLCQGGGAAWLPPSLARLSFKEYRCVGRAADAWHAVQREVLTFASGSDHVCPLE